MLEVRLFSQRDRRFSEMLERSEAIALDDIAGVAETIRRIREGDESELQSALNLYKSASSPLPPPRVSREKLDASRKRVSESFLTALAIARVNARKFHEHQRRRGYIVDDCNSTLVSRQIRALHRIGVYCGTSFATLVAHVVPAQVAGVGSIAITAAPGPDGDIDPHILAAARVFGIEEVYRMHGAGAVAAMAFGTGFMEKTDKIFGADDNSAGVAKQLLANLVGVDSGLGTGDLAIIADKSANARFVAGDLLAQAETGDKGRMAVLFTNDRLFAEAVRIEMDRLVHRVSDSGEMRRRVEECAALFLCPSLDAAVEAVNLLAPARLSLHTRFNDACLSEVESAGTVYMGQWSAEAAGGFFSGVNPLLPMSGASRFRSGLCVEDFVREITVVEFGPDRLMRTGRHEALLASEGGFRAQAETICERLELLKLTVD